MQLVLSSVSRTEFVVPRTLPFAAPTNITHGCNLKEFVHAVQSSAISVVALPIDHQFTRLCLATRRKSTSVAMVYITEDNVAVAKSDSVPIVNFIGDSGYDVKRSELVEHHLQAEGYSQAHECTEDAYGNKIQGGSTMVLPQPVLPQPVLPQHATVKFEASLPTSDDLSSSQSAQGGLSSSPLPSAAMFWPNVIPIAKESSESTASSKTLVAESSASLPSSIGPLASSMYLTCPKKKKRGSLPSHPPHRERSQLSPSSTGKPPPHAGEWEEPKQETPWEVDAEKAGPVPQIETMLPAIKPFTTLAGEDVSRNCSKGGFSDSAKQEAPMSSAPLRFVAYPQSPRHTLTFFCDCEMSADSAYGSVSTMQSTSHVVVL